MSPFEEWAEDKSFIVTVTAIFTIGMADEIHDALRTFRSGESISPVFAIPTTDVWLNLYRNHRKVNTAVIDIFKSLDDFFKEIIELYLFLMDSFKLFEKTDPEVIQAEFAKLCPEEWKTLYEEGRKELKGIEKEFMEMTTAETDEETEKELNKWRKRALGRPEMLFFLRVTTPCLLCYGDYPLPLLRKARLGDNASLEKLLRMDRTVLDDPKIKKRFHEAAFQKRQATIDFMADAIKRAPKVTIERQSVKYLLGGFLSVVSMALKQKLTAVEIHKCFDAVAQEQTGEGADPDFLISPEAFEKGIQRGRSFWKTIPYQEADTK